MFPDTQEAAFSNFRLWYNFFDKCCALFETFYVNIYNRESLAFAIAYGYSSSLCVKLKLYLLLVYLSVGIICYAIIEILERKKKTKIFNQESENKIEKKF